MLTPLDIETREFKKTIGGYNREDIDEFKRLVLEGFKSLYMENIALKDKVSVLSEAVQRYKSMEDIMQNTLLVAQSTSDELKRSANERAQNIISEADIKASQIIIESQQKVNELQVKYEELRSNCEAFSKKYAAMLRVSLELLEKQDF